MIHFDTAGRGCRGGPIEGSIITIERKHLKLLGLLTMACLIALLSLGAGSASADAFCRDNTEPCEEGYEEGVSFTGETKSAVLEGSGFKVTCKSTLEITANTYLEKGKGVAGEITNLTLSGCSGSCSVATASNLPNSALVDATEGGNGTVEVTSGGSGNPGLSLTGCSSESKCSYSASKVLLEFKGGGGGSESEDAKLIASGVPLTRTSGTTCPTEAKLSGTYVVTKVEFVKDNSLWVTTDDPILDWNEYEFPTPIKVGESGTLTTVILSGITVEYHTPTLMGNGAGVFSIVENNCKGQMQGVCTIRVKCAPVAKGMIYEALLEVPWDEVAAPNRTGIVQMRLRCLSAI